jgi:hypothetical protein
MTGSNLPYFMLGKPLLKFAKINKIRKIETLNQGPRIEMTFTLKSISFTGKYGGLQEFKENLPLIFPS